MSPAAAMYAHEVVGDDPYPKVTGDEYLWVDTEANMLVAEWYPGSFELICGHL